MEREYSNMVEMNFEFNYISLFVFGAANKYLIGT